jgi:hypothetical protein
MAPTTTPNYYGGMPVHHTLGPKCRLAPVSPPFDPSNPDDVPPVKAQFFYASPIPIDDPLSTSTIAATADSRPARNSLRPFSQGDNNALERAWLSLASPDYRRNHSHARRRRSPSPSLAAANADTVHAIVRELAMKHARKHVREGPSREVLLTGFGSAPTPDVAEPLCCQELLPDVGVALRASFCAAARRQQSSLNRDKVAQAVMDEMKTLQVDVAPSAMEQTDPSGSVDPPSRKTEVEEANPTSRPASRREISGTRARGDSLAKSHSHMAAHLTSGENSDMSMPIKPTHADAGISGRPFVRVGTPETTIYSPVSSLPSSSIPKGGTGLMTSRSPDDKATEEKRVSDATHRNIPLIPDRGRQPRTGSVVDIPVGVSRLHQVSLPALQMKPIYWSPVNDIATVLRATWFYR